MSRKTLKRMVGGALVACTVGAMLLGIARGTPPFRVLSNIILAGPIGFDEITAGTTPATTRPWSRPGGSPTPTSRTSRSRGGLQRHSHPGISFVMVRSGTATFYEAADPDTPQVYPAGTGFVEQPGDVHNAVNEGDTDLELVVFYLLPRGRAEADRRAGALP